MPKDKSTSHVHIVDAAMEEFMKKGFQGASIRTIADSAGITSGGLYRHFKDKEDMFHALVEPAVGELKEWLDQHVSAGYAAAHSGNFEGMWESSEIDMMLKVMYPRRREFKLILCCSQGTRYENFLEELINTSQKYMMKQLELLKKQGLPIIDLSEEELHMLMSAYTNALVQPIMHDYSKEDTEHYLKTIEAFFMPGWHKIIGC